MVTVGNDCVVRGRCEFTIPYQPPTPYQKNQAFDMCGCIPIVTGILARGAKPWGDSGLVYQRLPCRGSGSAPAVGGLYQSLPPRRRHNTQYDDYVLCDVMHSDWLWLAPNLTCSWVNVLCSRLWHWHVFWTWCGQGCDTCGAQSMTCIWLGFLRTVRTVVIHLAYSTPWLCFNSSIDRIYVNVVLSVMMWLRLHLTGGRCQKDFQKNFSWSA